MQRARHFLFPSLKIPTQVSDLCYTISEIQLQMKTHLMLTHMMYRMSDVAQVYL